MAGRADDLASDMPQAGWIDRLAPAPARPYLKLARLDRPIGTWLLLLPAWWGIALAAERWPDPYLLLLFAVGAVVMRGAGCTVNDIWDRDFDGRVARTAGRPLPSGAVGLPQAFLFLALQLALGLVVLLQLNRTTILLGVVSLVPVALYPLAKRITYWPQLALGFTFNFGALMGYAAAAGAVEAPAVALYAAALFWTLGYDTIYAHQDKDDDERIGLKSTALLFGRRTRPWLFLFYAAFLALLALAGGLAGLAWPFFAVLVPAALHLCWQAARVDIDAPRDCLAKFRSNRDLGLVVFAAIVLGRLA
jgi:4-hydroxybenzoate polyprenyltransferase